MNKKEYIIQNEDGNDLIGELSIPDEEMEHPCIIFLHDFNQNRENDLIRELNFGLIRKGYATYIFDFSGHGESQGQFYTHTISAQVRDTIQIITKLKTEENIDEDRIILIGHGLGGVIGILAAEETKLASLILLASRATLEEHLKSYFNEAEILEWEKKGYLQINEQKLDLNYLKNLRKISIEKALKKIYCPILIIQGTKDMRVPYTEGQRLYSYAINQKKIVLIDGADHTFRRKRKEVIEEIDNFCQK